MAKRTLSRSAAASLALGMLFWIPLLNFILGAAAVYLGIYALKKIRNKPEAYMGKFLAIGGIFLGLIPFYFGVFLLLKPLLRVDETVFAQVTLVSGLVFIAAVLLALKLKRLL